MKIFQTETAQVCSQFEATYAPAMIELIFESCKLLRIVIQPNKERKPNSLGLRLSVLKYCTGLQKDLR